MPEKALETFIDNVQKLGMTEGLYAQGKSLGVFDNTIFSGVSTEAYDPDMFGPVAEDVALEGFFSSTKDRVVRTYTAIKTKFTEAKAFIDRIRTPNYADTAKICTHTQVSQALDALSRAADIMTACMPLIRQQMMGSENGHHKIVSVLVDGVEAVKWPFGAFDASEGQSGEVSISKGTAHISSFSEMAAEFPKPLKTLGWTPETIDQVRSRFFQLAEDVNKKWGAFSKALVDVDIDTDAVDGQRVQASYGSLVALDSFMKMITTATTDLIRETFSQVYKRAQTYAKKA